MSIGEHQRTPTAKQTASQTQLKKLKNIEDAQWTYNQSEQSKNITETNTGNPRNQRTSTNINKRNRTSKKSKELTEHQRQNIDLNKIKEHQTNLYKSKEVCGDPRKQHQFKEHQWKPIANQQQTHQIQEMLTKSKGPYQ